MKNGLNRAAIARLAENLKRGNPTFNDQGFVKDCTRGLNALELKERVTHIAQILAKHLPPDYEAALRKILDAQKNWDRGNADDPLRGFATWPLFEYIGTYGLGHFKQSMDALRDLTYLFTAEFAVRPFIAQNRNQAMKMMRRWALHKNEHVRRLASEGLRPRLPWAKKIPGLIEAPQENLKLLELLKDDPSEYVRRSVGNHLNDIAKDHPDLVIDLCKEWLREESRERRWIVERATRTLVKQGYPKVWSLLGFKNAPLLEVNALELTPATVQLGGAIEVTFKITSQSKSRQKLAIDYAIHFVKADGLTRPKVFKLKGVTLEPRQSVLLGKAHPLKAITTRKYYQGVQKFELLINGQSFGTADFQLNL